MLTAKKQTEAVPVNEALLNVITPMGLEIRKNSLVIGENTGKVYGVIRYPQKVDYGWLSKITNIPSTIVSVGIKPIVINRSRFYFRERTSCARVFQKNQPFAYPETSRCHLAVIHS